MINEEYKHAFPIPSVNFGVLKLRLLAFSGGPGGFRELRGPGRNHFHLSWYLLVPGITSCDQKPWGNFFVRRRYIVFDVCSMFSFVGFICFSLMS